MSSVADVREALTAMRDSAQAELTHALDSPTTKAVADWPSYERENAFLQTVRLGNGEDCNYDRPTVGVAYACWYMARRINEAFHFLLPELVGRQDSGTTIIDLGCGTGATWWACRYISEAMRTVGLNPPAISIVACDTSLPMLELGKQLWSSLDPKSTSTIQVAAHLSSWTNIVDTPKDGVVFASYLFDQSDEYRIQELGKTLRRLADRFEVSDVYILGASNKRKITQSCISAFVKETNGWREEAVKAPSHVWVGPIPELMELRRRFSSGCSGLTSRFSNSLMPTWSDNRAEYRHLSRFQKASVAQMRTSNSFVLDAKQDIAATPDGRLTAILGAAGSGKSRVLVERVARSIVADITDSTQGGEYLVTCFNRAVVEQLQRWFIDRLRAGTDSSTALNFTVDKEVVKVWDSSKLPLTAESSRSDNGDDPGLIEVHFSTWDAIVHRRFRHSTPSPSAESERAMLQIIERWGNLSGKNRDWLDQNAWVTPKFVLQELKRVIYGQAISTLDEYLKVQRRGRPKEPQMRKDRREGLWGLIQHPERLPLWVDRRIAAHRDVRAGFVQFGFKRVYLDECQDFVEADFELISSLVRDPRDLVVCGDGTQALLTGPGYFRPRTVKGARWVTHELKGSYRLPIRICEAIEPLAEAIQRLRHGQSSGRDANDEEGEDIALPQAVRNAVVGCRPIVLAAPDESMFIEQISRILQFVAPLIESSGELVITNADEGNTTVASYLKKAVQTIEPEYTIENNSMLKIKGLERPCVFFSTRLDGSFTPGASTYEWTYTILTRPTSVLILNLSNATSPEIKALVGRMRRDCLFFWDQRAEDAFAEFAKCIGGVGDPFK